MQRQIDSLTKQVATMGQSYEQLIEELRERNRNGLIFLPFETLYQKVLMEGKFGDGIYAQTIDHPSVTILDSFILADVFINKENNDHFTLGRVIPWFSIFLPLKLLELRSLVWLIQVFSDDDDCTASTHSGGNTGMLPTGESYTGKNQKAFLDYGSSEDGSNAFPRWGQWT